MYSADSGRSKSHKLSVDLLPPPAGRVPARSIDTSPDAGDAEKRRPLPRIRPLNADCYKIYIN